MAPPAKRRRRNVVHASDDEDEDTRANTLTHFLISSPSSPAKTKAPTASPSPPNKRSASGPFTTNTSRRITRQSQSQKTSTNTSPKKSKGVGKGKDEGKTADIKSLFSKQVQRATRTGGSTDRKTIPLDDIISDPISEDDEISELKTSSSSLVSQFAKKRSRNETQSTPVDFPSASQKFLKPPKPAVAATANDDSRPWSERFGPRNLDELAVHKKKVSDVRRWLEDVAAGRMRQRLLVLKGAAGSGKTMTLRLLANDMGCELLEWRNPVGSSGYGFVSASAQFQEFLGRGGKFGALDTDSPEPIAPNNSHSTAPKSQSKRIMMIEEFPNTFSRSSSALTTFRSTILDYLAANTPSLSTFGQHSRKEPVAPVVLIISETLLTTTSASADSFTAHRLLGPEILRHPGVGMIEFNPIAPTLLAKALELVVQKEARNSGRKKTPGPQVLKRLGEIGDIRNAVASLEFLCLKGDQEADWGSRVAHTKQKKAVKDAIGLTKSEQDSLELISRREASLGIFHAVGKVVYNKREDVASQNHSVEKLPLFLSQNSRPKLSEVSVDSLIDETGTDTHTFISALHENYLLSCESTSPMDLNTSVDYVNDCVEYLSQSDLLCPSRDIFFGGRGGFTGADSGSQLLRQDEMTFQVAVRGMLFSLPNPVKRKATTMSKGSDAHKMFYPTSLKLWRAKEEVEGLVDMWSSKLLKGETNAPTKNLTEGATAFRRPQQPAGETSWMQRKQQSRPSVVQQAEHEASEEDAPILSLGSAAQREMLLERLPYMAQIARGHKPTAFRLRDLEKVTSFRGINAVDEESDAEDEPNPGEAWATDKPTEDANPRKKNASIKSGGMSGLLAQKLVISDDDIED